MQLIYLSTWSIEITIWYKSVFSSSYDCTLLALITSHAIMLSSTYYFRDANCICRTIVDKLSDVIGIESNHDDKIRI